jgi:hypothetical protein
MTVGKNRVSRPQAGTRSPADFDAANVTSQVPGLYSNFPSFTGQEIVPPRSDIPPPRPDYVAMSGPKVNFADAPSAPRTDPIQNGLYTDPRSTSFQPMSADPRNTSIPFTPTYPYPAQSAPNMPLEGKSIGDLHKARIQDNLFELPPAAALPPANSRDLARTPEIISTAPEPDPRRYGVPPESMRYAGAPSQARPPMMLGSDSATKVQDLLVQNSQLQAENEQAKFLNAELTRSKMLLAAEVEMLRQDQVRIKNEAAARNQDTHGELNTLMLERQSLIRQVSGLQTELRQREAVLDAVTEQRKQQNAALESQEMMSRRMHDEVAYLQEQVQLRTEEARKLRDQIARERFKADEDVSKVTSEVSAHLSQIASSRDAAHEAARDLSKQLKEAEKDADQYRASAAGEIERLRAETTRLALLVSANSAAAGECDALRAELREAARNKADLTSRMQVLLPCEAPHPLCPSSPAKLLILSVPPPLRSPSSSPSLLLCEGPHPLRPSSPLPPSGNKAESTSRMQVPAMLSFDLS